MITIDEIKLQLKDLESQTDVLKQDYKNIQSKEAEIILNEKAKLLNEKLRYLLHLLKIPLLKKVQAMTPELEEEYKKECDNAIKDLEINKNIKTEELNKLIRFLKEKNDLLTKYNIKNLNLFILSDKQKKYEIDFVNFKPEKLDLDNYIKIINYINIIIEINKEKTKKNDIGNINDLLDIPETKKIDNDIDFKKIQYYESGTRRFYNTAQERYNYFNKIKQEIIKIYSISKSDIIYETQESKEQAYKNLISNFMKSTSSQNNELYSRDLIEYMDKFLTQTKDQVIEVFKKEQEKLLKSFSDEEIIAINEINMHSYRDSSEYSFYSKIREKKERLEEDIENFSIEINNVEKLKQRPMPEILERFRVSYVSEMVEEAKNYKKVILDVKQALSELEEAGISTGGLVDLKEKTVNKEQIEVLEKNFKELLIYTSENPDGLLVQLTRVLEYKKMREEADHKKIIDMEVKIENLKNYIQKTTNENPNYEENLNKNKLNLIKLEKKKIRSKKTMAAKDELRKLIFKDQQTQGTINLNTERIKYYSKEIKEIVNNEDDVLRVYEIIEKIKNIENLKGFTSDIKNEISKTEVEEKIKNGKKIYFNLIKLKDLPCLQTVTTPLSQIQEINELVLNDNSEKNIENQEVLEQFLRNK